MNDPENGTPAEAAPVYGRLREANHRVRHDGWTGEKQRGFLEALARAGNVRDACRAVGMSNVSAYRLRRVDPAFGRAWDAALRQAATSLEQIAYTRAVDGAEEVVIRRGEEVSRRRKPSDALLRLLLQASNPEKFGRAGNVGVKAREEIEARVEEIERAAYRRAWRALVAEYRYLIEPEYIRHHILAKLYAMHLRLCENPWCKQCHPERKDMEPIMHSRRHEPPEDHRPLDPPHRWSAEITAEIDAEVLRMREAGQVPDIGTPPPPRFPPYDETIKATPPPFELYAPPALPAPTEG